METFKVKTKKFEGPLELLLELIRKRKLHISEVSLSKVADEFLGYMEKMDKMNVGEASHFVYTASTLILIKSKQLLPFLDLSEEEEEDIDSLEIRLKILSEIQDISSEINNLYGKNVLFGTNPPPRVVSFAPGGNLNTKNIKDAVLGLVKTLPIPEKEKEAKVRSTVTIEEMIDRLQKRIKGALRMTFSEFSGSKNNKVEVVVGFLALLELMKQGLVLANQDGDDGEIIIETDEPTTPNYS